MYFGAVKGTKAELYMEWARNVTHTCYQMYQRMPSGARGPAAAAPLLLLDAPTTLGPSSTMAAVDSTQSQAGQHKDRCFVRAAGLAAEAVWFQEATQEQLKDNPMAEMSPAPPYNILRPEAVESFFCERPVPLWILGGA